MPTKAQAYAQMADHAAAQITGSYQDWTAFLTTAARLYKYPYAEQLMIYAQKPEATACAEYDFWNEKMRRYVRRGSKGIALIDTNGDRPRLKYVFDISDTGGRDNSRNVNLWEYRPEHNDAVTTMLERNYEVFGRDGLADQLEKIAAQLADEYWNDNQRDILDIVDDSFLYGYDDFNVGVAFRNAATVSITYSLLSRCGLKPENHFEHEDFLSIFDFNTPAAVSVLGTAVSSINQRVLRQIEVTIRNYEREHITERSITNGEQPDVYSQRGLSDSQYESDRAAGSEPRQVREDAEEISSGEPSAAVESPDFEREAVPTPVGDRAGGAEPAGTYDAGADESTGRDREPERIRPDEMGGSDEQLQGASGGNHSERFSVQLSLFPSENEQISFIDQAESVNQTPFAFSFAQEDIDTVLRLGGNNDNSRQRVAAEFMMRKPVEEIAAFLSREYVGGGGFKLDRGDMAAWFVEDGIHLANGRAARYSKSAQIVTWNAAAQRIGEMLEQGQFATNVELAETNSYIRSQLAQSIWYLRHDFGEPAIEQEFLPCIEPMNSGGYPEITEKLVDALANPEFLSTLTLEYEQFLDAYREDKDLLRFHYHRPSELLDRLHDVALPQREYTAEISEAPQIGRFITEDEINAALSGGSSFEGGKGRIFSYFKELHSLKEQTNFLKNEYGTGGHNNALPGCFHSQEDHSSKGIRIQKPDCYDVQLAWNTIAKRISELIRQGKYLTPEEQEHLAELNRPSEPVTATTFSYADYKTVKDVHADDIVLYQVGEFFEIYGEDAEIAARVLDLNLTSRTLSETKRVPLCGIPSNRLEQYVEQLRDKYDVTISGIEESSQERRIYSLPSIDHEAERATNAYEAEFGADGWRAFPSNAPWQEETHTIPTPHTEITQDDIDTALRAWNGDAASKRRVAEYMADHAREKDTAAWLANEYGGTASDFLHITVTGTALEIELPWTTVQRRLALLIRDNNFLSEQETLPPRYQVVVYHHFENGFDEKLDYQTLAEAEKVAQGYVDGTLEADSFAYDGAAIYDLQDKKYLRIFGDYPDEAAIVSTQPVQESRPAEQNERFTVIETDTGYAVWDDIQNGIHVNKKGVAEDFPSEWQADAYLEEVRQEVSDTMPDNDKDIDEALDDCPITVDIGGELRTFPNAAAAEDALNEVSKFPYAVGDTVYLEDGKPFIVTEVRDTSIQLQDPTLRYPIFRSESAESFARLMERYPQPNRPTPPQPEITTETVAVYPAEENHLPYDIAIQTLHTEPEHTPPEISPQPENFRITDDNLGVGGAKSKFSANMDAIKTLLQIESDNRMATTDEQEVLGKYVGWGGLADAFDETKQNWANEYQELAATLSPEEYAAARASTLNAHYTSPTVIKAIYEAVGNMGFQIGNILEPAMGVGNFFGCMPEEMRASKLYGVELDSVTGRIAKQLYPQADITVAGFESTDRRDFFDLAIGNVPFGQYQVNDRAYNKLGFSIHDYFFAKSLDQVRPGGVVAFVTSRYTMDKQSPEVRKYIAQRAELLGAIRLPNNAFKANAGTEVVSDIIFLQKRDRPIDIEPDWVHLGENEDGFGINNYFIDHPEMILGRQTSESTQYGKQDFTVAPIEGLSLADQLHDAIKYIGGKYAEAELPELGEDERIDTSIPADPNVKNYSYTVVDGSVYYRENSRMVKPNLNATAMERVKGMVELRDCVHRLIDLQMNESDSLSIAGEQHKINRLYDNFSTKYGLLNDRANRLAFADDSSYYLLCSLEVLDDDGNLERKADMFTKRTIKQHTAVTSVDTASEALAVSIGERARVDLPFMAQLTGKREEEIIDELTGVIYHDPIRDNWQTSDEYLSGNVRQKLREAQRAAGRDPAYQINVAALVKAQPKDLDASEIEVRLGATWIDKKYIQQFMEETFNPPFYLRRSIQVNFSAYTAEWNITGKNNVGYGNVAATVTYGTDRANAYRILEDSLNLRDIRIYDTVQDADGKERRVLNAKETTLAAQKQQAIREAFKDWIWRDPHRRSALVEQYNEEMNSTRPREYDGSHITFSGMNPEIQLREHQKNAVAHVLYGGNTLLAHEVGAGKSATRS